MKGLGKKFRPTKADIVGVACLAAFIPQKGVSAIDMGGGKVLDWCDVDDTEDTMTALNPEVWFYPNVPEPPRSDSIKLLAFQSLTVIRDPAPEIGFDGSVFDGRHLYVHTSEDTIVPYEGQRVMIEASGVDWYTVVFKSAHNPFISLPNETVAELVRCAQKWKS